MDEKKYFGLGMMTGWHRVQEVLPRVKHWFQVSALQLQEQKKAALQLTHS